MILLDSSFLVSVEVETDQNYQKAIEIRDGILKNKFGRTFITDYIFDETITVTFGRTKDIKKSVFVGDHLLLSTDILKIDDKIFYDAWKKFKEQKLTKFSFTDCTTLSIMMDKGIKNIATFDEDFKKVKEINVIDSVE